ncbi:hypothetical protein OSTOST_24252 [Ostertagia ostertagi]
MDRVLGDLKGEEVFVYIDDVLVATDSEERHLEMLTRVFEAFRKAKLKFKPQKCLLMERQVSFLGHIISEKGVNMDPDKVVKIQHIRVVSSVECESEWLQELKNDADYSDLIEKLREGKTESEVQLPRQTKKLKVCDFCIHEGNLHIILEDGSLAKVVPQIQEIRSVQRSACWTLFRSLQRKENRQIPEEACLLGGPPTGCSEVVGPSSSGNEISGRYQSTISRSGSEHIPFLLSLLKRSRR